MQFSFEWNEEKNKVNIEKHQISFYKAQIAFLDLNRIILKDLDHSNNEDRYFCLGKVEKNILTVRFTTRNNIIRIFGAGYWRKEKKMNKQIKYSDGEIKEVEIINYFLPTPENLILKNNYVNITIYLSKGIVMLTVDFCSICRC